MNKAELAKPAAEDLKATRDVGPRLGVFIAVVSVAAALFHIYALGIESPGVMNLRAGHLLIPIVLVPVLYTGWKSALHAVHWFDLLLIAVGIATTAYICLSWKDMVWRYGVDPTMGDLVFGAAAIFLVLELTRRAVGWSLVIIVGVLVLYSLFGGYAPGIFVGRSFSWERIVSFLYSMDGLYGIPMGVSSTYIYLFILFGAMLRLSKAGDFYMDLAYSIAGRARGGPAKVSIFASALFGTISGTGIGNVVTTGALTIPLMIRNGFKPIFAGAIESVASSGGQIMPPIMGAGAFLMAEFVRVPYGSIAIAALLPAFLYFLSVYLIVDLQASKDGMKGMRGEDLPKALNVLRRWGHLLVPIIVLIVALAVINVSPIRAALYAMGTLLIVSWLRVESRLSPSRLVEAAVDGAKGSIEVIVSCASAGLIMGLFSLTGIGLRLSGWVAQLAFGSTILSLVLTMLVTIVLSMGLPTTAAYIVSAAVLAPTLTDLGISPLQAHMFIFYFACLSGITPPVALVAIPAGSIAGANPFKVGVRAFQIALAGFIIPYMFVYSPELLLKGDPMRILLATGTAMLGVWALAVAVIGGMGRAPVHGILRMAMGVAAVMLIFPGLVTDVGGLTLVAAGVIFQRFRAGRGRPSDATP